MSKLCPTCGQLNQEGTTRCDCGHRFAVRENAPPVTELAESLPPSAWLWLVFCLPATWAVLMVLSLFRSGPLSNSFWLLGVAFLAMPIMFQLTRSGRRQGGCLFGCLAWVAVLVAVGLGALVWDYDHDPTQDGIVYHNLLFVPGQAMACDGVELGMDPAAVARVTGHRPQPLDRFHAREVLTHLEGESPAPTNFVGARYADTTVWYLQGKVVRVEGSNLSQQGKVLIRRGDPRGRLEHLFRNRFALQKTSSGYLFVPTAMGRVMLVAITDKAEFAQAPPPLFCPTANAVKVAAVMGAAGRGRRRH